MLYIGYIGKTGIFQSSKLISFLLKTFQTNPSYCWMSVLVSGLHTEESFRLLVSTLQSCCLVKIK